MLSCTRASCDNLVTFGLLSFALCFCSPAALPEDSNVEASERRNVNVKPHSSVTVSESGVLHRTRHVEKKEPKLVRHELGPAPSPLQQDELFLEEHMPNLPPLPETKFVEEGKPVPRPRRRGDAAAEDAIRNRRGRALGAEGDGLLEGDEHESSLHRKGHHGRPQVLTEQGHGVKNWRRGLEDKGCNWHTWGAWTPCTKSCASGTHTRERTWSGPCHGSYSQSGHCNTHSCPIDCTVTDWGLWGSCTKSCETGTRARYRSKVGPWHNGKACPSPSSHYVDSLQCNTQGCPIDCVWNSWGGWGECSKSCGVGDEIGKHKRHRTTTGPFGGGKACTESNQDEKNCNEGECPVDCVWSEWQDWTVCPVSCGGEELSAFNTHKRTQTPEVAHGGRSCMGVSNMNAPCGRIPCPIHCVWAEWTEWGECSGTCGDTNLMNRTRVFLQEPMHGGNKCVGDNKSYTECNVQDCPVDCEWAEWQEWSKCSEPCGDGFRQAIRDYLARKRFGGTECDGSDIRNETCNLEACNDTDSIKARAFSMHPVFPLALLVALL